MAFVLGDQPLDEIAVDRAFQVGAGVGGDGVEQAQIGDFAAVNTVDEFAAVGAECLGIVEIKGQCRLSGQAPLHLLDQVRFRLLGKPLVDRRCYRRQDEDDGRAGILQPQHQRFEALPALF